jgi:hypothetical protein
MYSNIKAPSRRSRLLLLPLGPSRLRRFPGLLFALCVCESFGRRFATLAAQLYRGGVLLFGHAPSITTALLANQMAKKCQSIGK